MVKTLVYLASGPFKAHYLQLGFDRVYLVDTAFQRKPISIQYGASTQVIPLSMDALEAVELLKNEGLRIDCLVTLCESVGEGGQTYAMCSDVVMGYLMPLLSEDFIWVCNDLDYYPTTYRSTRVSDTLSEKNKMREKYGANFVSLNLPYIMEELHCGDPDYLSPSLFTSLLNSYNCGHVFRMHYVPSVETITISGGVTVRLIQDSIWNHYGELDRLFVSFRLGFTPMKDYFEKIEKVVYYRQEDLGKQLDLALNDGLSHIGFTPHYRYQYESVFQTELERFLRTVDHPMTIDFFYLNSGFHTRFIRKAVKTLQRKA